MAAKTQSLLYSLLIMEADKGPVELVPLLRSTVLCEKSHDDAARHRRRRKPIGGALPNSLQARHGIRCDVLRAKSMLNSRTGAKSDAIVFVAPRFQPYKTERAPKVMVDAEASDTDSPQVVSVSDDFNPYTSLESGSYSGPTYVFTRNFRPSPPLTAIFTTFCFCCRSNFSPHPLVGFSLLKQIFFKRFQRRRGSLHGQQYECRGRSQLHDLHFVEPGLSKPLFFALVFSTLQSTLYHTSAWKTALFLPYCTFLHTSLTQDADH